MTFVGSRLGLNFRSMKTELYSPHILRVIFRSESTRTLTNDPFEFYGDKENNI